MTDQQISATTQAIVEVLRGRGKIVKVADVKRIVSSSEPIVVRVERLVELSR